MNISVFGGGADSNGSYSSNSIFVGRLPMLQNSPLKSTQEKAERQQKANSEIEYWEEKKESLKNMECEDVEGIARKLDTLRSYEDEIAAARAAYNNEQMFHVLDEAKEWGEKIAKAAEKMEPKTPEERREEILEEIAEEIPGTEEETDGVLEEIVEEAVDMQEEMQEQLEDMEEKMAEGISENTVEPVQDDLEMIEEMSAMPENVQDNLEYLSKEDELERVYRPFDVRI